MPNLPSGTVTFVFSDIEGSTILLKQLGDGGYAEMLGTHRRLVREVFGEHGGQEIDTQGDAFFYSFARARDAVLAAVALQRAHHEEPWPGGATVRIRLGLHTGEPAIGEDGYTGLDVVRASRIAAVARGGQVLLSDTTRALVAGNLPDGVSLRSLGQQRLRDIDQPEPLHELAIPDIAVSPERVPPPLPADGDPAGDALAGMPDWIRGAAARVLPSADRMSRMIEERVLAELDESLREERAEDGATRGGPPAGRPSRSGRRDRIGPPDCPGRSGRRDRPGVSRSVSDEIARLRSLREDGTLTAEQYARAVDRVISPED
jgi:class 3 adenylate cyclase